MKTKRVVISKSADKTRVQVVYKTEAGKVNGEMKYTSVTKHERIKQGD